AKTRAYPDAVRADERDRGNGGVADLRSQLCEVVKDGIRRRVEHLVLVEGLDAQSFVFDQESIHFDLFNRRICAKACALLLLWQQQFTALAARSTPHLPGAHWRWRRGLLSTSHRAAFSIR